MSLLQMFACEGCSATAEATVLGTGTPYAPDDWLSLTRPATEDEAEQTGRFGDKAPTRHVCSPACLVVLARRLAEMPQALQPCRATA